jgi:hypothetical protein
MTPPQFARAMRCNAVVLLLALPTILFPPALVRQMHAGFGLGDYPATPLVEYLTRSAALCYGLHGFVLWGLASDVVRYRPLIRRVYRGHLVFALSMALIDLYAGMPFWWLVTEAGTIATVATLMLRLFPESHEEP